MDQSASVTEDKWCDCGVIHLVSIPEDTHLNIPILHSL